MDNEREFDEERDKIVAFVTLAEGIDEETFHHLYHLLYGGLSLGQLYGQDLNYVIMRLENGERLLAFYLEDAGPGFFRPVSGSTEDDAEETPPKPPTPPNGSDPFRVKD